MNKMNLEIYYHCIYLRHGHSHHNVEEIYNSNPKHPEYFNSELTQKGKDQVKNSGRALLKLGFNPLTFTKVFVSPLPRTIQTAEVLCELSLIKKNQYIIEDFITELQVGHLESQKITDYTAHLTQADNIDDYESYEDLKKRLSVFVKELKKEKGNLLIISHKCILETLILLKEEKIASLETGGFHISSHLY
jgi:broad specificity phosphatase PhoE